MNSDQSETIPYTTQHTESGVVLTKVQADDDSSNNLNMSEGDVALQEVSGMLPTYEAPRKKSDDSDTSVQIGERSDTLPKAEPPRGILKALTLYLHHGDLSNTAVEKNVRFHDGEGNPLPVSSREKANDDIIRFTAADPANPPSFFVVSMDDAVAQSSPRETSPPQPTAATGRKSSLDLTRATVASVRKSSLDLTRDRSRVPPRKTSLDLAETAPSAPRRNSSVSSASGSGRGSLDNPPIPQHMTSGSGAPLVHDCHRIVVGGKTMSVVTAPIRHSEVKDLGATEGGWTDVLPRWVHSQANVPEWLIWFELLFVATLGSCWLRCEWITLLVPGVLDRRSREVVRSYERWINDDSGLTGGKGLLSHLRPLSSIRRDPDSNSTMWENVVCHIGDLSCVRNDATLEDYPTGPRELCQSASVGNCLPASALLAFGWAFLAVCVYLVGGIAAVVMVPMFHVALWRRQREDMRRFKAAVAIARALNAQAPCDIESVRLGGARRTIVNIADLSNMLLEYIDSGATSVSLDSLATGADLYDSNSIPEPLPTVPERTPADVRAATPPKEHSSALTRIRSWRNLVADKASKSWSANTSQDGSSLADSDSDGDETERPPGAKRTASEEVLHGRELWERVRGAFFRRSKQPDGMV